MRLDEAAIQGFLATREVVVLATVQADGAPLAMPMWFLHGPATLTMISVAETQKVRNLRRDARVCVVAEDVAAGGEVRGRLERLWNGRAMPSNRVMFRFTPARVRGWGLG